MADPADYWHGNFCGRRRTGAGLEATAFILFIAHRLEAAEALRESEEKFRKAFILSPDSININRLQDGMYVSINNGFTKIMGYTADECHR